SAAVSRVSALKGQTSQPFVIASIDDGAIASVASQDFISEQSERTSAQRELDLEKVHQSLEDLSQVQSNSAEDEVALTPTDIARTNLGKTSDPDIAAPSEKPGLDLIDIPVAVRGPLPSLPDLELPNLDSKDYLPSEWQGSGPVKFIWPAKGTFTSGFGWRWGRMHRGIDVAAPVGTPIVASAPGVVTYSQYNRGGYGNLVEITHPDGSLTLYAHNHRNLVKQGQFVSQGQQIAEMGNTGRSTGPHTHFELHKPGRGAINPVHLLGRG
ncbi:MAG: M23 family metallopeptidase, partial [Cyanobacteria bacterium P01_F01_bin.42]